MSATRHRMANADAAWLRMDTPTNLMIINSAMLFDEPLSRERLERVLRRAASSSTSLGSASASCSRGWAARRGRTTRPSTCAASRPPHGPAGAGRRRRPAGGHGDLMSTPLDMTKPLWHAYLAEGLRGRLARSTCGCTTALPTVSRRPG